MSKILVVDDEHSIRTVLGEFLKEDGHDVFTAEDADRALEIVKEQEPDVVISDIILPRITGITLLQKIGEIAPSAQVIVITGEPTAETAAEAVRAGAFDYLSKPIARSDFKTTVASALRVTELSRAKHALELEKQQYQQHLEEEVERKTHELRASEEKYRAVVENAVEAVFIAQDGVLPFANPSTAVVCGRSLEALQSTPFLEIVHEGDRQLVGERHMQRLAGEEGPPVYEFRIRRPDKEIRWIELRSVLIEWDGRPATLNFANDITLRKKAQEAREESESRYRSLFEESPASLWLEDYSAVKSMVKSVGAESAEVFEQYLLDHPDFLDACIRSIRVLDINQATVALHGAASKEELLGSLSQVIPEEAHGAFIPQLVALYKGETSYAGTSTDQRLDGNEVYVSVRWVAAPGYERSMSRVLVSKLDVTAAVQAESLLQEALNGTIQAIGMTTETRDPYTAGHQRRVTELAVAIAEEMGLARDLVEATRAAGLLHDIGKMAIPAEILSKPSALSAMERALIESHPQAAFDILRGVTFPWPLAEIVLQHHERVDGSGYPRGLSGEQIRIEAKILAVADTVEAMASHRPYRPALGINAALDVLREQRGEQYDLDVANTCLRLFEEGRFEFSTPAS